MGMTKTFSVREPRQNRQKASQHKPRQNHHKELILGDGCQSEQHAGKDETPVALLLLRGGQHRQAKTQEEEAGHFPEHLTPEFESANTGSSHEQDPRKQGRALVHEVAGQGVDGEPRQHQVYRHDQPRLQQSDPEDLERHGNWQEHRRPNSGSRAVIPEACAVVVGVTPNSTRDFGTIRWEPSSNHVAGQLERFKVASTISAPSATIFSRCSLRVVISGLVACACGMRCMVISTSDTLAPARPPDRLDGRTRC